MKIRKSVFTKILPQYLLIYCIAATSGSLLFVQNQVLFEYGIIGLFLCLFIYRKSNRLQSAWYILIILLASIVFVRFVSGGIGIDAWLLYACQILSVYCAFLFDTEKFLDRFVKLVAVMAFISVIAWLMQLIMPTILDSILQSRVQVYNKSHTYTTTYKGLLFYTYSTDFRNCGIYTEPGRYQAILQGALFCTLFCQKYLHFERKNSIRIVALLIFTILTTQATTGYIMLFIMILFFLITRKNDIDIKMKRGIIALLLVGITFLVFNFIKYGSDSILGDIVFGKLQGTDIEDMSSSGGARLRMIEICIWQIVLKPWGGGLVRTEGNIVAAGLVRFIAALGVIPGIAMLLWIFAPIKKAFSGYVELIAFASIYIYLGLAQSYAFYSGLLTVPIALNELYKYYSEEAGTHEGELYLKEIP